MLRQQIPNAQIRDSADSFKAAWDLLEKQSPGFGFVLPQINVGAIAIELYLKCLAADVIHTPYVSVEGEDGWSIVTAKPETHGHNLGKIFGAMDPQIQQKIEHAFSSMKPTTKKTFLKTINDLEGAYLKSRYSFQSGYDISKYDLRTFGLVVQCLHDFVSKLEVREWVHTCDQINENDLG